MYHRMLTITTKKYMTEENVNAIMDDIIEREGKNLLTMAGSVLTKKEHAAIWKVIYND